jgi:hypothetical protein
MHVNRVKEADLFFFDLMEVIDIINVGFLGVHGFTDAMLPELSLHLKNPSKGGVH